MLFWSQYYLRLFDRPDLDREPLLRSGFLILAMPEAHPQQSRIGIGASKSHLPALRVAQQVEALMTHQVQLGLMQVFPQLLAQVVHRRLPSGPWPVARP